MADTSPPGSPAPVPRVSRKRKAKQIGGVDFHEIDEILEFGLQGPDKVQRYLVSWKNVEAEPTWENGNGICAVAIYTFWSKVFTEKAQYEGRRTLKAKSRPTKKMQKNISSANCWEELKKDGIALELGVDSALHLPNFIKKCKSRVNAMWKAPFEVDDGDDERNEIDEEEERIEAEEDRNEQNGHAEEEAGALE